MKLPALFFMCRGKELGNQPGLGYNPPRAFRDLLWRPRTSQVISQYSSQPVFAGRALDEQFGFKRGEIAVLNHLKLLATAASAIGLAAVCLPALFPARAEILPVKIYTAAAGLPRDAVHQVKQDARGFLWFCTSEGLARFDGYGFKLYGKEDGLPSTAVLDFLETRSGLYLLATSAGLVRFNPNGARGQVRPGGKDEPMFVTYLPGSAAEVTASLPSNAPDRHLVETLYEDAGGVIWAGTRFDGLFRLEERAGQIVLQPVELNPRKKPRVVALAKDHRGYLWAGAYVGVGDGELYRLSPQGQVEHFTNPGWRIHSLLEDAKGRLWAGVVAVKGGKLCRIEDNPVAERSVFSRCYTAKDGLPDGWVRTLVQTTGGAIWAGTAKGAARFDPDAPAGQPLFQLYQGRHGICDQEVYGISEDRDGNLWFSTRCGAAKLARNGFVRYTREDGLDAEQAASILTGRNGQLIIATNETRNMMLHVFDGRRFVRVKANTPQGADHGWGWGQVLVNSRAGDWWFPSEEGAVYRFPAIKDVRQLPQARPRIYRAAEGFTDKMVWQMYEDSRGDVWFSTSYQDKLLRWDHQTNLISDLSSAAGNPQNVAHPQSFAEDRAGNLWMSSTWKGQSRLSRYRDGRFKIFTPADGLPASEGILDLLVDGRGRLWMATPSDGVGRIDDPSVEPLKIIWHNRANGLSSNNVTSLVEDRWGRIYAGTPRGVDCLNPETGQVRVFSTEDGLPKGDITVSGRDASGALWFSGTLGLARYAPEPPRPNQPPAIFLTGLFVAGAPRQISEIGVLNLPALELGSSQTNVRIEFRSPSATSDPHLRYQYKLDKLEGREDWSAPTDQRSVDFANLSAGNYRFLARAVNADGVVSAIPAGFSFTVAAPVWRRWWFIALTAGLIGGLAFAAYRYRVTQLLAMERMRTRIATDLHDEVGSSLSQIAILSEVARLRLTRDGQTPKDPATISDAMEPMEKVAVTSREAVDAMSDIVWAINPQRDQLSDLSQRMRLFASDTLTARDIRLRFHAPEQDLSLDAEVRRQVFLIFKECVNNIVRHADCTEVEVDFTLADHHLSLRVRDDGRGFVETRPQPGQNGGNGLLSMRRRAADLGGKLEVISGSGGGTIIKLEAPLVRRKIL